MTFLEFQRADQNSCQRKIRIIKGETGKESPEAGLKGSETSRLIKTRRLITWDKIKDNQALISVQSLGPIWHFATLWIAAHQASLSITSSRSLLKLMSIELVMPFNHLILCRPLLLLLPIPPWIRVFSNESTLRVRWPKYWSFSFSISPSNEHPGLISFRMDWWDLLAVQGTLKSLLQHHSSKHQFFGSQLSSQSNSHIHTRRLEKP